jgi:aldehyde:ferredoxin oxidoreductase
MSLFGRKAADSAAAAVARVGQKVAGEKGVKAANKITGPLFGQTFERCSDACGHCNVSCVNGTCNH